MAQWLEHSVVSRGVVGSNPTGDAKWFVNKICVTISYMKICISCNTEKPLDDFQKRASARDGYTGTCKPCKREYDNKYYLNNPNRKTYITKNRKKAKQDAEAYILDYLLSHPCIDCGETDPIVLEFDHVSGTKKKQYLL